MDEVARTVGRSEQGTPTFERQALYGRDHGNAQAFGMEGFEVISQSFDVSGGRELSEQDFLFALARRISEMLDSEAELLFSTLYRLDIFETKINAVLNSNEDTALGLAQLVVDRQKEKIATRKQYKVDPKDPLADLD